MKAKRYITALGAFFVLVISVAACGSGVPGDAVANVAGNPVTLQAFDHWMFVAAKSQAAQNPGQPVIVPNDPPSFGQCVSNVRKQIPQLAKTSSKTLKADCQNLFNSLKSQVMPFLIEAYWYQAQAAKEGITVSDAEVMKAFDTAKNQQFQTKAQYQAFLAQTGQTQADIVYRFRIHVIFTKLLAKRSTKVTPAQIQSYYKSHLSQFGTPQTRDVRLVLAKTAAQADAAKAALQHGQSWAAVVKKYSTDPTTKSTGGLLQGLSSSGSQDAALTQAAMSAPKGALMGPVKAQFGYYVFEVVKIHPATQQSLSAATPIIRQTLSNQNQNNAQTALNNQIKKAWQGKTTCRSDYAVADCKGYKAPATTPTATTG
ncbi:MAG TPA: peptidyl-prolyl cis-trans isomerase [Solirubrobacteraceae bacterium]|nr:peptidyl-prolyl cis-trans isomerase [Solirubrobacteraceae bacterium]